MSGHAEAAVRAARALVAWKREYDAARKSRGLKRAADNTARVLAAMDAMKGPADAFAALDERDGAGKANGGDGG